MKTLERYEIEICEDCLAYFANGEVSDNPEHDRPNIAAEIEAQWPKPTDGSFWEIANTCSEDCEGSFSWQSCESCGSRLGGNRHPAVAMRLI